MEFERKSPQRRHFTQLSGQCFHHFSTQNAQKSYSSWALSSKPGSWKGDGFPSAKPGLGALGFGRNRNGIEQKLIWILTSLAEGGSQTCELIEGQPVIADSKNSRRSTQLRSGRKDWPLKAKSRDTEPHRWEKQNYSSDCKHLQITLTLVPFNSSRNIQHPGEHEQSSSLTPSQAGAFPLHPTSSTTNSKQIFTLSRHRGIKGNLSLQIQPCVLLFLQRFRRKQARKFSRNS